MEAHPIPQVGPFKTQGSGAWLFPSAVMLLGTVLLGYIWLALVSALSASMTCSMEMGNSLVLASAVGCGVGSLMATTVETRPAKILVSVVVTMIAAAAGFAAVQLIYAPHCRGVLPLLRPFLPA